MPIVDFRYSLAVSVLLGTCAAAWPATSPVFNVLDYGAVRDGSARSTIAIRKAIAACAQAGGGTVYIPAGAYVTGAIELVSNMVLDIDAGATLRFHADRSEYPWVKGRLEGVEAITPAPLIGGRNLQNVTITGRGTLTADNRAWMRLTNQPEARAMWESIWRRLENGKTVPEDDYKKAAYFLRPSFIRPMDSRNILIEGIRIVGSPMWTIHLLYCENVVIRDVIIETYPGHNTDGIDIDSCRHVRISDSYLDTGDDSICLKSGRDADGRRVNRVTEDVAITNCTVRHGHGAVALGSETAGGIRNVAASNIVCQGTERGIRIKSTRGRGGTIENIRFNNWIIEDAAEGIEVTNYYTQAAAEPVSARTPVFRTIALSNITINRARMAASIEGLPEMPISGLRLSGVIASARTGLRAFNAAGMELDHVRVNCENGPAFLIRDSDQLNLGAIESSQPLAGAPVVRLDRTSPVFLHGSRAWPGTGVFLSIEPGARNSVTLEGNSFGLAKTAVEENRVNYWEPKAKNR